MIKALALFVIPIASGIAWFALTAPPQTPGTYVATDGGTFRLPPCKPGLSSIDHVSTTAAVVTGSIPSFLIALPRGGATAAGAAVSRLFLRVVDHAAPRTDYGRVALTTIVSRLHGRVYRVTAEEDLRWNGGTLPWAVYRDAIARIPGNRATTELLVELEIPGEPAGPCRQHLVLGPPPGLPNPAGGWFIPPPERSR